MGENDTGIRHLISRCTEVFGTGLGTFVWSGGDPSAALVAMAGSGFGELGNEMASRVLSPRQEARVGAVFFYAGSVISAKKILGEKQRDDGFFEGEHSFGHELAEGVMLTAMKSFEERKIQYLGNMLANIAFIPTIDSATANSALQVADELSWLELCLIGVIDRSADFPLPDAPVRGARAWNTHTVRRRLTRMADIGGSGLLNYGRTQTERVGLPLIDTNLSTLHLTNDGKLIAGLMELSTIPDGELRSVYNLLLQEEDEAPDTTGNQVDTA